MTKNQDNQADDKPHQLSLGVRLWFWFFLALQMTGFIVLLRWLLYLLGVHLNPWVI